MVYAVQMWLGFRNTARRDGTQTNIINKCVGLPQFGALVCVPFAAPARLGLDAGAPVLNVEARFTNQADRDDLWLNLDTYLGTGINGPVVGSRAWIHDCTHDEGAGGCVIGPERTW